MSFTGEQKIRTGEVEIHNLLPERGFGSVRKEILEGLHAEKKYISPKFFYDRTGSELFEEITRLKEYYPTRCEKEILSTLVARLDIDFHGLELIELGSGDSSKISLVFEQLPPGTLSTISYYPVDISQSAIRNSVKDILARFDLKKIEGFVADFHHQLDLIPGQGRKLFCFPGSTIGNFEPGETKRFMEELGTVMNEGDALLLGADMVKETAVMEAAYNDSKGITARFNKNILRVVNAIIGSDFNTDDFEHRAFYNHEQQKIEMHLIAGKNLLAETGIDDRKIQLRKGESIHTENSYKFTREKLEETGSYGNMKIKKIFPDSKGWFNIVYYTRDHS